jgi:hypothetical protein
VHLQHTQRLFDWNFRKPARDAKTSVVHQQIYPVQLFQAVLDGLDAGAVRQVGWQRSHLHSIGGGKLLPKAFQPLQPARYKHQIEPSLCQLTGKNFSYPTRCPSDQRQGWFTIHVCCSSILNNHTAL